MGKTITTRLSDEFVAGIKEIAEKEQVDTSTAIRKLLARAISEWKKEQVLEDLKSHKISIGQAAKECGISIWEIMDLAKEKKIDWMNYTEEDLERELKILEKL